MSGPITIFDKSAFQMLSRDEHVTFCRFYMQNLVPVLVMEVVADLSKKSDGRPPEATVKDLARKFIGSGPAINTDYRKLAMGDLLGVHPSLAPQIQVDYGKAVYDKDGNQGLLIELHEWNEAILRWSKGEFQEGEKLVAGLWREFSSRLSPEAFRRHFESRRLIIPRVGNLNEAVRAVDHVLNLPAMQEEWISWLCAELGIGPGVHEVIVRRFRQAPLPFIRVFAPYAYHCLRVLLLFHVANKHRLVGQSPTIVIDCEYLYYLPFCHVFVSRDGFHRKLAPHLLRPDQSFVWGDDFREDLRRLTTWWNSLSEDEQETHRRTWGSTPPRDEGSITWKLWKRHLRVQIGKGDIRHTLTEDQKAKIVARISDAIDQAKEGKSISQPEGEDGFQFVVAHGYRASRADVKRLFGVDLQDGPR